MKVAIDISGQFNQMTGIQHSVDSLLNALFAIKTKHEIRVFVPDLWGEKELNVRAAGGYFQWVHQPYAALDFAGNNFAVKDLPGFQATVFQRKIANVIDGRIVNPYKTKTTKQRALRAARKYDVLHVLEPPGLKSLEYPVKAAVLTIYDVTPITVPHLHRPEAIAVWTPYFDCAKYRAARVITISEYSKADIVKHLGISADRVDVTPLAPRASAAKVTDQNELTRVREKFSLQERPFVLYAGTLEPRKNLMRLLEAFAAAVADAGLHEHRLVLAGGHWADHDQELRARAASLGIGERVILTGYVSNADMNALMSSCEAFAYVSEYEGFGLPPLEAMVCGAPVVSSNTTSLPEVVGDAGLQVDPLDVDAIAGALRVLLTDAQENQRRRGLSLAHAQEFSWERTARLTLETYEKAAAQ